MWIFFVFRYSRDWRFHKGQRVWLTRSQYGGVKEQTSTYEKGSYNVFDPVQWRKVSRFPKQVYLTKAHSNYIRFYFVRNEIS